MSNLANWLVGTSRIHIVALVLLALNVGIAHSQTGDATDGPFWMNAAQDIPGLPGKTRKLETLEGKSVLFIPREYGPNPRYDRRILFTFAKDRLIEKRVLTEVAHKISPWHGYFHLDEYLLGYRHPDAARIKKAMPMFREPHLAFVQHGDASEMELVLLRDDTGEEGGVVFSLGWARELTDDEARRFTACLDEESAAERKRREADLQAAGDGPLHCIDAYGYTGGPMIHAVYFGEFDKLYDKRFRGGTKLEDLVDNLAADARRAQFFRTYHRIYADECADRLNPGNSKQYSVDLVKVDGFGNVKETLGKGESFFVRREYADSYEAARRGNAPAYVLSSMLTMPNPGSMSTNVEALYDIDLAIACRRFIHAHKDTSPGTLDHFEKNLERAFREAAPDPIAPCDAAAPPATLRLPWELTADAGIERLAQYGISWRVPASWSSIQRSYGIAAYHARLGGELTALVHHRPEPTDDLLPYINSWLTKDGQESVIFLEDVDLESFEVQGRPAHFVTLTRAAHALIQDKNQTWVFTIYGDKALLQEGRAELRSLVESVEFFPPEGAPAAAKQDDKNDDETASDGAKEKRERAIERRSRLRGRRGRP